MPENPKPSKRGANLTTALRRKGGLASMKSRPRSSKGTFLAKEQIKKDTPSNPS